MHLGVEGGAGPAGTAMAVLVLWEGGGGGGETASLGKHSPLFCHSSRCPKYDEAFYIVYVYGCTYLSPNAIPVYNSYLWAWK